MKLIIFILLSLSCIVSDDRIVRVNDLGWTFKVPQSITFKDSSFDAKGNIINSSWDNSLVRPKLLLFNIQPKDDNHFNCIIFIDSSDYSSWQKATISVARGYFNGIAMLPNFKILDTSLTSYKIDGIEFQKEYVQCVNKDRNDTLYSFRFSRLYNRYDVNINVQYTDPTLGKEYLKMINESRFEK